MNLLPIAAAIGFVSTTVVTSTVVTASSSIPAAVALGTAAVSLDIFKYLAYPLSNGLIQQDRKALGFGVLAYSLCFSIVCGLSSYQKIHQAITPSKTSTSFEEASLESARMRLNSANSEVTSLTSQYEQLTLNNQLKAAALVDTKIKQAKADAQSAKDLEVSAIRDLEDAKQSASTSLSPLATTVLALLFAIAIELVPALILLSNRSELYRRSAVATGVDPKQAHLNELISNTKSGIKLIATKLSSETGLSVPDVKTTLSAHPNVNKSTKFFIKR